MTSIAELIAAHRAADAADEINFDAERRLRDQVTLTVCHETLTSLIEAPCLSAADVQAKIAYFVSGKNRMHHDVMTDTVDLLVGCEGVRQLLRSLIIAEAVS